MELTIGSKYGKWTVTKNLGTRYVCDYLDKRIGKIGKMYTRYYLCTCECGSQKEIPAGNLKTGRTSQCSKCSYKNKKKYGQRVSEKDKKAKHPLYSTYHGMVNRCKNPKNKSYKTYGARGIRVCDRWLGKGGFENFVKDMGDKPSPIYSIDRIDNDGDYEPSNCRWATPKLQNNNKSNNLKTNVYAKKVADLWNIIAYAKRSGVELGVTFDDINKKLERQIY